MAQLTFTREELEALAAQVAVLVSERLESRSFAGGSPWLNAAGAAEYLGGWPEERIRKLTASREIPCRRVGRRVLYHRAELDAWLDRFSERRTGLGRGF